MVFFIISIYNMGMDMRKCTHCGRDDITVKLRELALIPGFSDAKSCALSRRKKIHRKLCKDCFEQASREIIIHRQSLKI